MRAQLNGIVEDIADAITRMEGTGGCGPRNNPGNLRSWGSLPTTGGFAVFPTCAAGRAALEQQVQRNIQRGLTLEEFFGGKAGIYPGYAPAADSNDPDRYARNVAAWAGLPLGVPLDRLSLDTTDSVPNTPWWTDTETSNNPQEGLIAAGIIAALAVALLA